MAKMSGSWKNFGVKIENKQIPVYNIIADVESNINKIQEGQDRARRKIANTICSFLCIGQYGRSSLIPSLKEIKAEKILKDTRALFLLRQRSRDGRDEKGLL